MVTKFYAAVVTINDDTGIVHVTARASHLPGKSQKWETAWPVEDGSQKFSTDDTTEEPGNVLHPVDGHEITTYDNRNSAIGEVMANLRDEVDQDQQYR